MSELLVVLVDCNSATWEGIESEGNLVSFPEFCASLLLFLSAFTSTHRRNRLMVLGYNSVEGGYLLLPTPDVTATLSVSDHMRPASYCPSLEASFWRLRYGSAPREADPSSGGGGGSGDGSYSAPASPALPPLSRSLASLTSCLNLALCSLNARRGALAGSPASTRLVCFHSSPDPLGQYIAFNNGARSAHHMGVVIDSVVLGAMPSVFLQQAAHQTGGLYLHPATELHKGLLHYFLHLLLPPAELRTEIHLPPRTSVNLKAHCLCHKRFCETAFMCTTCLSLWCQASAVCPACSTSSKE